MLVKVNRDDSVLMNELCPKIYVACLASYNAGKLHGKWLDATLEVEELLKDIKALLAKSPEPDAEEFEIHDYEGFYSAKIEKYDSLEAVHDKALFISEQGALGAALLNRYHENLAVAKEVRNDCYQGEYENELEFAMELFDDAYLGSVPKCVRGYIDYEAFKTDRFIDDYFSITVQGRCYVFSQH